MIKLNNNGYIIQRKKDTQYKGVDGDNWYLNYSGDDPFFEAFYKTDASRGCDKTGSGLGLCAAKEIINAHGEIIGCKESKMGGARFEFTLKLSEE